MKTNAIESLHRSVISKFNKVRGKFPYIYYKDVEVEPAILPLVGLLNNEWSLIGPGDREFAPAGTGKVEKNGAENADSLDDFP